MREAPEEFTSISSIYAAKSAARLCVDSQSGTTTKALTSAPSAPLMAKTASCHFPGVMVLLESTVNCSVSFCPTRSGRLPRPMSITRPAFSLWIMTWTNCFLGVSLMGSFRSMRAPNKLPAKRERWKASNLAVPLGTTPVSASGALSWSLSTICTLPFSAPVLNGECAHES